MAKFILGMAVGALVMSVWASSHPKETQAQLKRGADTISSAIAQGATSVGKLADQQLPQAKK